jgi:hypothetical protein
VDMAEVDGEAVATGAVVVVEAVLAA